MEQQPSTSTKNAMRRRVNELLEEFWEKIGTQHAGISGRAYQEVPAETDLSTGTEGLRIEMDLPGVDVKDIEVSLRDQVLTIAGEKRVEREVSGRTYLVTERSYGSFARSFMIPESVDTERLSAAYDKGVLTVTAPVKKGAQPQKKIKIHSS